MTKKTKNFTLRLPEDLAEKLDAMRRPGQSRQAQIVEILSEHTEDFDPGLVIGFVELRGGEIDPKAECPECGCPFGDAGVWLGFTGDLKPFGPVCGLCATTA